MLLYKKSVTHDFRYDPRTSRKPITSTPKEAETFVIFYHFGMAIHSRVYNKLHPPAE